VPLPRSSSEFFALTPADVAAILLDRYAERGELRMHNASFELIGELDAHRGLSPGRRRQAAMLIAEACNLLERVGAACRQPDSADHRVLLITMRGQRFFAADDPAEALRAAAE
jgi:hypothetical protein